MRSLVLPLAAVSSAALLLAGCGGSNTGRALPSAPSAQSATRSIASTATTPAIETETIPGATLIDYPEAVAQYARVDTSGLNKSSAIADAQGGRTIPLWQSSITDGGNTYQYIMAGPDPSAPHVTNFDTQIVALSYTFAANGNYVLDPNIPGCVDSTPALQRTLDSPVFQSASYPSGETQYIDAFQRANFWTVGGSDPSFHANFKPHPQVTTLHITVPVGIGAVYRLRRNPCERFGVVDFNWFYNVVRPQVQAAAKTQQLPLALSYNVFEGFNGPDLHYCCVLGYHDAVQDTPSSPILTYAVAAYNDPGIFRSSGIQDIHALSHEFGEWIDDPLTVNPTPPWGHIGQVGGCQNNLETGDPLTGTVYAPVATNGYTYHPQELVFFSWFYHQTPSIAQNGVYSNAGTFTTPAAACT